MILERAGVWWRPLEPRPQPFSSRRCWWAPQLPLHSLAQRCRPLLAVAGPLAGQPLLRHLPDLQRLSDTGLTDCNCLEVLSSLPRYASFDAFCLIAATWSRPASAYELAVH